MKSYDHWKTTDPGDENLGSTRQPKIKTENQATRVWVAYDDNTYDGPGSTIGWGPTKEAAIADLMEQLEDAQ